VNLTVREESRILETSRMTLKEKVRLKGDDYRLTGVIQYSPSVRHFRCLKQLKTEDGFRWYCLDREAVLLRGRFPD